MTHSKDGNQLFRCKSGEGSLQEWMPRSILRPLRNVIQNAGLPNIH